VPSLSSPARRFSNARFPSNSLASPSQLVRRPRVLPAETREDPVVRADADKLDEDEAVVVDDQAVVDVLPVV